MPADMRAAPPFHEIIRSLQHRGNRRDEFLEEACERVQRELRTQRIMSGGKCNVAAARHHVLNEMRKLPEWAGDARLTTTHEKGTIQQLKNRKFALTRINIDQITPDLISLALTFQKHRLASCLIRASKPRVRKEVLLFVERKNSATHKE